MNKLLKAVRRHADKAALVTAGLIGSASASAADWSTMTGSLDFSGETTGVIAVVGTLAGFYIVRKGGRLLLSMIK